MATRRTWILAALAGLLLSAAGLGVWHLRGGAGFGGAINALGIDLARPDAYIHTPALSRLPRDLVKAPIARDLLTEDFVNRGLAAAKTRSRASFLARASYGLAARGSPESSARFQEPYSGFGSTNQEVPKRSAAARASSARRSGVAS